MHDIAKVDVLPLDLEKAASISKEFLEKVDQINERFRFLYTQLNDTIIGVSPQDLEKFSFSGIQKEFFNGMGSEGESLSAKQLVCVALLKLNLEDSSYIDNFFDAFKAFQALSSKDRKVNVYPNTNDFANIFTIFYAIFYTPSRKSPENFDSK